MTDEKKPDLKVLQFPSSDNRKKEEEAPNIPLQLVEKIEKLNKVTKEGRLRRVVVSYAYDAQDDEEMIDGEMFFWHDLNNMYEIVGAAEAVKTLAIGMSLGGVFEDE